VPLTASTWKHEAGHKCLLMSSSVRQQGSWHPTKDSIAASPCNREKLAEKQGNRGCQDDGPSLRLGRLSQHSCLQWLKAETLPFPGSVLVQPPQGTRRCPDPGRHCDMPRAPISDKGFWNEISLSAQWGI